jgi:ribonuclease P protein subunit POP4
MVQKWRKELIGSQLEVVDSRNKTLIGMKGKVVNETKNTIELDNGKKILKSHITIKIEGETIEGEALQKRPEDRIKK